MRHSICEEESCPNFNKVANHPRSKNPTICGICGNPVKITKSEFEIKSEKERFLEKMGNSLEE